MNVSCRAGRGVDGCRLTASVQPPPCGPRQRHRRSARRDSKTQKSSDLVRRKAVGWNTMLAGNLHVLGRHTNLSTYSPTPFDTSRLHEQWSKGECVAEPGARSANLSRYADQSERKPPPVPVMVLLNVTCTVGLVSSHFQGRLSVPESWIWVDVPATCTVPARVPLAPA